MYTATHSPQLEKALAQQRRRSATRRKQQQKLFLKSLKKKRNQITGKKRKGQWSEVKKWRQQEWENPSLVRRSREVQWFLIRRQVGWEKQVYSGRGWESCTDGWLFVEPEDPARAETVKCFFWTSRREGCPTSCLGFPFSLSLSFLPSFPYWFTPHSFSSCVFSALLSPSTFILALFLPEATGNI